jgi:hypothetical protein
MYIGFGITLSKVVLLKNKIFFLITNSEKIILDKKLIDFTLKMKRIEEI